MKILERLPVSAVVLVVAAVAAGCQAGPAASAPSGTQPIEASPGASRPTGTATATGAPAGTPVASLFRVEVAAEPLLVPADGPAGSAYVMPAAGTRAQDGTLVLVIVWFHAGDERPTVALATSADGTTWDVGTTHVLGELAIGHDNPGPIPAAIVELDDGSWQMYGWASANASGTAFLTWRTSAPALGGPWALDGEELLAPGPAGDWDSFYVSAGSVLRTDDGFAMWFEGEPPGSSSRGDIGLATSTDGLAWTKLDDPGTTSAPFAASDPVITTGVCGPATSIAVEQPQVERIGEGYVALFGGFGPGNEWMDVFGAVSDDGRTWRCGGSEPLLAGSALADGEGIHSIASIALGDGRIGLIAESLITDHSELWWATVSPAEE